ncbi:MAG: hypothetical protein A3G49_01985 [Candidatus Sungbacteria bacterium RIFCSPLOWO2_12_FULL_41_11]|uniref:Acylphosphatase n=1 Tax=Candidatus Sungbacteria bacterium RIFCSPLOWO2_12_FULL_41_11 TaxID=1802286 RepID=A0A1G2LS98_9BACT|nr:MAG: Acylphosphatase [Parcubacteria group bacterium GW2011_GWA2_42_14]OHA00089.1 MAG: hypothetical protein A3D41_00450 [Candidatus Sungbacteria bacterium RIFCSPHIGHO2_02_FULL_41_12b]OHA14374.1 MAG: hypothetical protein A3G49_01985 [Candidatus Sungbacteria bacterium RIFCSPLOWO2_12_FULL_41_11]
MERTVLKITGRVQGVFFRQTAKETAQKLGIAGFAKNENDGNVTIVAEGKKDKLVQFIGLIKRGFDYTEVKAVSMEWGSATEEFKDFNIF